MDIEEQKMWRNYAWAYFAQHAEQRLKAFNFYVTYCAIVTGAFATIASRQQFTAPLGLLPLSLTFFSFIFWKLDVRTKMLIKNAEAALMHLDDLVLCGSPASRSVLAVFKSDINQTKKLPAYPLDVGHFTYSRVFNWVFVTMSLVGFLGAAGCVLAS